MCVCVCGDDFGSSAKGVGFFHTHTHKQETISFPLPANNYANLQYISWAIPSQE